MPEVSRKSTMVTEQIRNGFGEDVLATFKKIATFNERT